MKKTFSILESLFLAAGLVLVFSVSYSKPPVTRIFVAFGYKDTRPSRLVGDRYERVIFSTRLEALGFRRDVKDDDRFDLVTDTDHFQVELVSAATGPDDVENRLDPYQAYVSGQAKARFLSALSNDDLVLYEGHSRDGGGPDFEPPLLLANGHVNYPRYQREHLNASALVDAWTKNPKRTSHLGLISCYSEKHFLKLLQNRGEVTTVKQLIYYTEAMDLLLSLVKDRIQLASHT